MAEAIGIGASIATFIALAGQLFHGCHLLSEFLNDVVDAPDDVRYLHAEIRGLQLAIHGFQSVLQQFEPPISLHAVEDQIQEALLSSGLTITSTRGFLEVYTCHRKWEKKLLTARNKRRFKKYIDRLGKSKSDISLAQGSAILILNIAHRSHLKHLSEIVLGLGSSMVANPQSTIPSHSRSQIQRSEFNSKADSFAMCAGSMTQLEFLSAKPDAVPIKVVEPHYHVQSMDLGNRLRGPSHERTYRTAERKLLPEMGSEGLSCVRSERRSNNNICYTQTICLWFLTITIYTIYSQTQKSSKVSNHCNSTARKTYTVGTRIDVHPQTRLLQRGIFFTLDKPRLNSSSLDSDMRFRVYNLVHWNSPVAKACRTGTIAALHGLFLQGLASPYDFVLRKFPRARITSLVDIVWDRWLDLAIRLSNRKSSVRIAQPSLDKLDRLLKMCQFLTGHGRAPTGPVRWQEETVARVLVLLRRRWSSHPELSPSISAMTGFILSEATDYPLGTKICYYHDTPSQIKPQLQEWTKEHEAYIVCPNELPVKRVDHQLSIIRHMKIFGAYMSGLNSLILDPDAIYLRKMLSIISPNYKVAFLTSVCIGAERQAHAMTKSGMGCWDHAVRSRLVECLRAGMDVQAITYHYGAYSSLIQHFVMVGKEDFLRSVLVESGLEAAEISVLFEEQACAFDFLALDKSKPVCHYSKFMNLYAIATTTTTTS